MTPERLEEIRQRFVGSSRAYDAMQLFAEIARLRAANAKLLAACKAVLTMPREAIAEEERTT